MINKHILTQERAQNRSRDFKCTAYRLWLNLESSKTQTGLYQGLVDISIRNLKRAQVLVLDSIFESIEGIRDGEQRPLKWERVSEGLSIELPQDFEEGLISIRYTGRYSGNGHGFFRFVDPMDHRIYTYTDLEPFEAHTVFPCLDQPDQKASMQLTVEAPENWVLISNSLVQTRNCEAGRQTVTFHETKPQSTYVFCLVAGEYHMVDGPEEPVPFRVGARHSVFAKVPVDEMFSVARDSLVYFERLLKIPYPYTKYDQIFVPEYTSGAMENVGLVTFSEYYLTDGFRSRDHKRQLANTVAHEMCHMWFGNLVTMKWWGDLWLNESFATKLAYYALKFTNHYPEALEVFTKEVKAAAMSQDELPATHPIIADCKDTEAAFLNFDRITYEKGACVLQQLVAEIGEGTFWHAIHKYLTRHAYDCADWSDFKRCLEETSGKSLDDFAEDWLTSCGVNTLETVYEGDGRYLIRQQLGNGSKRMRKHRFQAIALRFFQDRLLELGKKSLVLYEEEMEIFHYPKDKHPDLVFINHQDWLYARVLLDQYTISMLPQTMPALGDPFLRLQLWMSLTDMMLRDVLNPRDYLTLFLQMANLESDDLILNMVYGRVSQILYHFLPVSDRELHHQRIFSHCVQFLEREDSMERLKPVFSLALNCWAASEFMDTVQSWWQAGRAGNLVLDTSMHWDLFLQICHQGQAQAEDFRLMLAKDKTELGQKRSLRCEVAAAKDKTQFLTQVYNYSGTGLETLTFGMGSVFHPLQIAGMEGAIRNLFASLPSFYATRDKVFLRNLMDYMFPWANPDLALEESLKLLADENVNPTLAQVLRDKVEVLQRGQRIRNQPPEALL